MSLELTGVHGLLKRHKLFTHKKIRKDSRNIGDNAEARDHFSVPSDKC